MPRNPAIEFEARELMALYGPYLTFGMIKDLLHCSPSTVPHWLHQAGILVQKIGPKKLVSVYDFAEAFHRNRVEPFGRIKRATPLYNTKLISER